MDLLDTIQPIKLLGRSHADTATTGHGCFMNVVAYLNGDPVMTDESPCVCVTVRPIAIQLNDMATDAQRQRLLPFVMRAMGSATEDRAEMLRRAWLAVDFANECAAVTNEVLTMALAFEAAGQANFAEAVRGTSIFVDSCSSAACHAASAADRAVRGLSAVTRYAAHEKIFQAGIRFLDAALPPAEINVPEVVRQRAATLRDLANA